MEKIKKLNINDENYPKLLKSIKNPPQALYYSGKIKKEELCFAIVGTRRYSSYGKRVALEIASDLSESGLTIVSGLAPGIDTFSHQATIEIGGRTIAVLGTGIDEKSIYPKSNLKLARKILETGGCLVSEYESGTHGSKITFPQRNRIISGLSLGVLVIEAKKRSGALITARWAKSQGKKIFAIPGSIFSSNSKGCHSLIKQGVKLVENANDILKELNLQKIKKPVSIKGETSNEDLILQTLKEKSLHIDEIIKRTKLDTSIVISTLATMEIKSKVRNLGSNIYAISHR
jgi:DNA processing protein